MKKRATEKIVSLCVPPKLSWNRTIENTHSKPAGPGWGGAAGAERLSSRWYSAGRRNAAALPGRL